MKGCKTPGRRRVACLYLMLIFAWMMIGISHIGIGQTTQTSQSLKVGVFDNPPIVFKYDGQFRGIAVAFLEDVAKKENWRLQYEHGTWRWIYSKLKKGEIDLLVGIAYTSERAKLFDFTTETLINNWGMIYQQKGGLINSLLELEDKRIALMAGSIHSSELIKLLTKLGIKYHARYEKNYASVFEAVESGEADAGVVNRIFATLHSTRYAVEPTSIVFNPVEVRYACPKGCSPRILSAIDAQLQMQKSDPASLYARTMRRYLEPLPAKGTPVWLVWTGGALGLLLAGALVVMFVLRRRVKTQSMALKRSDQRLHMALKAGKIGTWEWWPEDDKVYWSKEVSRLVGLQEDQTELAFGYFMDRVYAEDRLKLQVALNETVNNRRPLNIEFRVLWPDGSIRWLESQGDVNAGSNGRVTVVTGTVMDITGRVFARDILQASEEKFSKAFEACPDAMVILSRDEGCFYNVNRGFTETTGYLDSEVIDKSIRQVGILLNPRDYDAFIARFETEERVGEMEVTIRKKSGELRTCLLSGEPILLEGQPCFIAVLKDVTERNARLMEMQYQATHDSLTGLPNRYLLHDRIRSALENIADGKYRVALLLLDLDRFKEINDTLGHHYGDLLLKKLARRFESDLREEHTLIARLGGDEFAVLVEKNAGITHAKGLARRIHSMIKQPFNLQGLTVEVGCSIGIALATTHADSASTLLRCADVAMYQSKRDLASIAVYNAEEDYHTPKRLALISELGTAIRENQLVLYYQPKVHLQDNHVTGVEALLRWNHPTQGFVAPSNFVPFAEVSDLITPLTLWVVDAAVRQVQHWKKQGLATRVAVNLSARNLLDNDFSISVNKIMKRYNADPDELEFEITESAILADTERSVRNIQNLNDMGFHISIDDYGTGYSSLSYLKRLPIQTLKIDLSFVKNMIYSEHDTIIVRSTVNLAHNLGLDVIAEGVEYEQTVSALKACYCDQAQGFYISSPVPAEQISRWYSTHNSEFAWQFQ